MIKSQDNLIIPNKCNFFMWLNAINNRAADTVNSLKDRHLPDQPGLSVLDLGVRLIESRGNMTTVKRKLNPFAINIKIHQLNIVIECHLKT